MEPMKRPAEVAALRPLRGSSVRMNHTTVTFTLWKALWERWLNEVIWTAWGDSEGNPAPWLRDLCGQSSERRARRSRCSGTGLHYLWQAG